MPIDWYGLCEPFLPWAHLGLDMAFEPEEHSCQMSGLSVPLETHKDPSQQTHTPSRPQHLSRDTSKSKVQATRFCTF